MQFGPDDEDAFAAFRDRWVRDVASWSGRAGGPGDTASDLDLLLDWKWGYGDGRLDRWQLGDLEGFLLEWRS